MSIEYIYIYTRRNKVDRIGNDFFAESEIMAADKAKEEIKSTIKKAY